MTETKKNPIGRFIENTLVPISTAFAQNRYVRCIGTGSQNLMAIIMIGAVFNLLNSIQIDPYQSFIQATGIAAFLNAVYNACMNFMGVFMVFSVGYAGAKIFGHDEMAFNNGLMSLMSYLIMVPVATNEVGSTVVVLDYLGSHGFGLEVVEVGECDVDAEKVSSTVIRRLVAQGDMARAARLLSHPYLVIGTHPHRRPPQAPAARRVVPSPHRRPACKADCRHITKSDNPRRLPRRACRPNLLSTMLSYDCQIRVWYKHTDQMGICHHSNYICYYEAARSELLRYLGMSFAEVEKRGIMMPILEVQSKYHRPAYYDELLTVRIMLRELPTARINFFYEIYNGKGELLNTGMTQLGFIHSDTRRPCRVPDWFLKLVADKWTEE